jgi:hypothetical protein
LFLKNSLEDWLRHIRLSEYYTQLCCQGYLSVDDVVQVSISLNLKFGRKVSRKTVMTELWTKFQTKTTE